jgi:hypothetical protein
MMDDEGQTSGAADEGQAEGGDAMLGKCYMQKDCKDPLDGLMSKENCRSAGGLSWKSPDGVCTNY